MTESHNHQQRTLRRAEYVSRINRVLDTIQHDLAEELSLDMLAKKANFSRFHFHRIFKAMVGETVNQFIQRLRVERAAVQLLANPRKSVTEIALDCGYSSSATFARAFKESFRMSASEWRCKGGDPGSKMSKTDGNFGISLSNDGKAFSVSSFHIDPVTHNPKWRINMNESQQVAVEVKEIEEMNVAYVRHIGPYQGNPSVFAGLFAKLRDGPVPEVF